MRRSGGFDAVGFALVATFLGALEVMLDRGRIDDWFGSSFIVVLRWSVHLPSSLMIPWELGTPQPLDRRADAGDKAIRRVLRGDAGDRRHSVGDDTVPAAACAAGFRLYGDLGRAGAVAGRSGDDGDDVRCGAALGKCSRNI